MKGQDQEQAFVVVGFRVDQERSAYYRRCKTFEELKQAVEHAFTKKHCDFVSIRWVRPRRGTDQAKVQPIDQCPL